MKTGRVAREEGVDWRSVVVVVVSVPIFVYVVMVKHRYHPAARRRSLPELWARTKAQFLPKHVQQNRDSLVCVKLLDDENRMHGILIESLSVINTTGWTCCVG